MFQLLLPEKKSYGNLVALVRVVLVTLDKKHFHWAKRKVGKGLIPSRMGGGGGI